MRFALLFMAPILLFGGKDQDWKTGKVLDSATAKTYVSAGDQSTVPAAIFQSMTIRDTQLVIAGDEFAYVIEDTRTQGGFSTVHGAIIHAVVSRHHGCRFIVGDSVKFFQEKAVLRVIDADGKECKAEVLRQERVK